ncbi:hypothetical protein M513_00366 [Trichuris suis]|uniref:Uncharacterized protein n=1 Tax=Trichuris suis TaxID=68888 RepID=A0A085MN77_9BILA|nr:hypothetical protein M513_00366 [Trichuris suis]
MVYKRHNLSRNHFEVFDQPNEMKLYLGVGPGYAKSYLDYAGKFRGGARKFLPIYQKEVAEQKEVVVKGGCGAKEEKEAEEKEPPREKRCSGGDGCHVKGVGPGYAKSYLDYAGKFRGGARKFLPIYRKVVSEEKEVVVKGGCGAKEEKEAEEKEPPREKRCSGGDGCHVKGVGPGYAKSYLDYAGKFRGGARKFLPIYQKEVSEEKEVVVKGGCGAKEEKEAEEKEPPREKRCSGGDGCHVKGVGPGYAKSYLDYAGKFRGGARKFLPIYQKEVSEEKEVVVKGGCGAKEEKEAEEKEPPREKRCSGGDGCHVKGVGPGYAKSYLDYAGKFRGGARKFLPIYQKEVSEEKEVVVKGGCGAKEEKEAEEKEPPREKRCSGGDGCHVKGVGPGYAKSYLDYAGKFRGGARKFLPIYRKEVAEEKEVVVKGGCGAKEEKEPPREKRCSGGDGCHVKGVGPGYAKSYLDYAGKFRGGARKFLPIYRKVVSEEKEVVVKGGCGAKEEKEPPREKREAKGDDGHDCIKGVGAGYAKSYLDYAGKFKGGARKFVPIYKKVGSASKEVVIKGGAACAKCGDKH